jgi:hypothetical protein
MDEKQILLVVLVVAVACVIGAYFYLTGAGAPASSGTPSGGTTPVAPGSQPGGESGPMKCSDAVCLQSAFLACTPSTLEMPFQGDTTYTVTVLGLENGTCHFKGVVSGAGGVPIAGMGSECWYPKSKMTDDAFGHLFGSDKVAGKEQVLQEQNALAAQYCTSA